MRRYLHCIIAVVYFVCCFFSFSSCKSIELQEDKMEELTNLPNDNNSDDEYMLLFNQLTHKSSWETHDRFNLLFFSDAHAGGHTGDQTIMNNILEWGNKYKDFLDDVLHGGDIVADNINPADYSSWNSSPFISTLLQVIGNHDVYTKENGTYIQTEDGLATYNRFFAPYIENWNVIKPADAATIGKCYYYKDYTDCGIRLIVTDCMHYDDVQKSWFVQTLAGARDKELNVIAVCHWSLKVDRIKCNFSSLVGKWRGAEMYAAQVQDFINAGGKFICWLTGHTHYDDFGVIEGYPDQLVFTTINAGIHDAQDTYRNIKDYPLGSFNIITVSVDAELLTISRIGIRKDEFNRSKNALIIDYKNKIVCQCY